MDICNVTSEFHEVYDSQNNNFIPIIYNAVTGSTNKFVLIKKGFNWNQ